ncbi:MULTISPECIES: hypothetical protein [Brenneria]|uniref:hypothetical protein n=1 Tax=Brenneria TaxID=71655 RepID=UPI00022F750C|nr:hypothetical protein BrE312_0501 [Brenneria sp. EniD312]
MALSDLIIRQAKANGKTFHLPDCDGSPLRLAPHNSKWTFTLMCADAVEANLILSRPLHAGGAIGVQRSRVVGRFGIGRHPLVGANDLQMLLGLFEEPDHLQAHGQRPQGLDAGIADWPRNLLAPGIRRMTIQAETAGSRPAAWGVGIAEDDAASWRCYNQSDGDE